MKGTKYRCSACNKKTVIKDLATLVAAIQKCPHCQGYLILDEVDFLLWRFLQYKKEQDE
jgi:DNA-directed RNA polymerase subunit RPC12/RpoP